MIHTKFNLKQLIRQLEAQNNRDYEYQQIAKMCGLSRFTVASIANNGNVRIELSTISKLLAFFESQGMNITAGDLFVTTHGD